MKKIFLVLLMVAFAFTLNAQAIKVTNLMFSGKKLARSAGDSTAAAVSGIISPGGSKQLFAGQVPDSIKITWTTSGDSTANCKVHFKARVSGSSVYTSTLVDSITASTVTATQGVISVPGALFNGYDEFNVALLNKGTVSGGITNPLNAATASKFNVFLVLYYKAQAYRP